MLSAVQFLRLSLIFDIIRFYHLFFVRTKVNCSLLSPFLWSSFHQEKEGSAAPQFVQLGEVGVVPQVYSSHLALVCESIVFNLLRSSLIHKAPFPFTVLLERESRGYLATCIIQHVVYLLSRTQVQSFSLELTLGFTYTFLATQTMKSLSWSILHPGFPNIQHICSLCILDFGHRILELIFATFKYQG